MSLDTGFYILKRQQLAKSLPVSSLLILAGNAEILRTGDTAYPFRQSSNFLYLTGLKTADLLLVIEKDSQGKVHEKLYAKKLHPFMQTWEGKHNDHAIMTSASGISFVEEYEDLDAQIELLVASKPNVIYIDMPDELGAQPAAWRVWRAIQAANADQELTAINSLIAELRVIKEPAEAEVIRQAIAQTHAALEAVQPLIKPGTTELELAAAFVNFASARGLEQAWPPVVATGKNICTIHHTPDDTKIQAGDLVLLDVGIEVGGYASDISRTFMVGEISKRQQDVLDAVRQVQQKTIGLIKPGMNFRKYEGIVDGLIIEALVGLGIFTDAKQAAEPHGDLGWPAFRSYYMHRASHYLGLDAHDVGDKELDFAPGMVLACEPGIYIAEEGIGVRIEDDILVTETGNENLSAR